MCIRDSTIGDYIIDGLSIVGRVVNINFNTSEVITVKSINYGDEVFINGKSYIVSGTNNNYLSFLRQKESTEIPDFKAGDIAVIYLDYITLRLGVVSYENNQPILLTSDITNLYNDSDERIYVASNSFPSYPKTTHIPQ